MARPAAIAFCVIFWVLNLGLFIALGSRRCAVSRLECGRFDRSSAASPCYTGFVALIHYFAYGSNMLTERLQLRCASARARQVAYADNWTLTFSKRGQDGSGKATISAATGGRVFGVVFDLNESELPELDRFEGAGKGYDRKGDFSVRIAGSQEPFSVVTYAASPSYIDINLKPFDWYLNLVVAGARQHALPPEYVSTLEAAPSRMDSKTDRQSQREAIQLLRSIRP